MNNFIAVLFCFSFGAIIHAFGSNSSLLESKVIGGVPVLVTQMTFVVSLRELNQHFCGGALLTYEHAVTAGTCALTIKTRGKDNKYQNFSVLAGGGLNYAEGVSHNILDVDSPYHEAFRIMNIGIIILKDKVKPSPQVSTIVKFAKPQVGDRVYTAGWGSEVVYSEGQPYIPTKQLKRVTLYALDNRECNEKISDDNNPILKSQICAAASMHAENLGRGDVGSPLVNSQNQLIGIATHLFNNPRLPSIYLRILTVDPYIKRVINPGKAIKKKNYNITLAAVCKKLIPKLNFRKTKISPTSSLN